MVQLYAMRAKYCLILVSWVALNCYICVGKVYSKVSLRMEFTALLGVITTYLGGVFRI